MLSGGWMVKRDATASSGFAMTRERNTPKWSSMANVIVNCPDDVRLLASLLEEEGE